MPAPLRWLAAIATGLALWASHPPLDLTPLAFVALIPLLAALTAHPRPGPAAGFALGALAGFTFFTLTFKWLSHVAGAAVVMLGAYLALYPGLWGAMVAAIAPLRPDRRPGTIAALFGVAAAWTGLEWLRGVVFTGFGWNGLGVALHRWPALAAGAEWIGVTGLGFWIVLAQAAAVQAVAAFRRPAAGGRAATLVPAGVAFGAIALFHAAPTWWLWRRQAAGGSADVLNVALIQPNIPQERKNLRDEFDPIARTIEGLTTQALAATPRPSVIVWPESALPSTIDDPAVMEVIERTMGPGDFTLVFGIDEQLIDRFYNSVAVVRGGSMRVHAKVHLVPFGEYLPARSVLGRIRFLDELLPGDFDRGESFEPLPLEEVPGGVIPLVCFEDTVGRVARKFARPGRQLIINVTNDAWFRDSEGAEQHLANAVLRCVELRRPMVRAANTGVTAVIDAGGHVVARLPRLSPGRLAAAVPMVGPDAPLTFYARHGDLFAQALGLAGALVAGWRWRQRRSGRAAGESG
jgi:apolipoprotein N-acyltransferase